MPRVRTVAPLLFASGACSLLYQTAWLRELRLVFGASTAASAAVLAIFIGGLGAGGLVLGPRADRHQRPLVLYAHLEALIAAFAALTPLWIALIRALYIRLGGTVSLGMGAGSLIRLVLAALVLGAPTFFMGGTLSAAARAVETHEDRGRRDVALLYGVNTLGAVMGCLVGTFLMFEIFGTRRTLWIACLLNALVALLARAAGRRMPAQPDGEPLPPLRPSEEGRPAPAPMVYAAAAVAGFVFFLMELVWYRMLGPILGGTVFTFGLILAMALLGIALGGLAFGALRRQRPATLTGFAYVCLAEAICVALPYAAGDRVAFLAVLLRNIGALGFLGHVATWAVVTSLVVLPAAFASGFQFPQLIALAGRGRQQVGRHVGLVYAWNTAGAIAGSLAGGFGLLPALTAPGCWRLCAWALLALAAAGAAVALLGGSSARVRPALALAGTALVLALVSRATGPTAAWRHSAIGVGRIPGEATRSPTALRDWANGQRRALRWEAEGRESSVAMVAVNGLAFVVNGKVDGNARNDASTQVMGGLLGALLHPDPRRALVIGLGTGSTAGWLGAVATMEKVEVVELEPAVLEVARACAPVNHDVLQNPKVAVRIGDAREVLQTTRDRYDIIFSEPSNPYRSGIASLFTRDFYQAAATRLRERGLFLQWVQAYEIDGVTLRRVYAALASVFPAVEIWRTKRRDLVFVAGQERPPYDLGLIRRRMHEEPYRSALASTWRVVSVEGVLARYLAGSALVRRLPRDELTHAASDDLNPIEFGFARGVYGAGSFEVESVRAAAAAVSDQWPRVDGPIDFQALLDEDLAISTGQGVAPEVPTVTTPARTALALAQAAYVSGDLATALRRWREVEREPRNLTELALLAEALADGGDATAADHAEKLRGYAPVEADLILGRLHFRRGQIDQATTALESAFVRHRTDPWPATPIVRRALALARQLAKSHPDRAERMYAAISTPFAVMVLEEERREAALSLVWGGPRQSCVGVFAAYEPFVPWRESFLERRRECYVANHHPLALRAIADLAEFVGEQSEAAFGP